MTHLSPPLAWLIRTAAFLLVCLALFPATGAERLNSPLKLTQEEEIFIRDHPTIRVHNETDWPPFNFYENGRPQGFSIDYMNMLADMIGIKVEYVTGPTWGEFLEKMKDGSLDVMLNIVKTPERQKYLLYTESYAFNPNSILSRRNTPYDSLEQLFGKTVALPKGFFYEEILKRDFPRIKLHLTKDVTESMKAVVFGKADAALGELAVFNYLMGREMMPGLVLSGEVKLGGSHYSELNIATRKDQPILVSILRKAVATIPPEKIKVLRQRWISVAGATTPVLTPALTPEETAWINAHTTIRMAALRDWPPFDYQDEGGKHAGISAELTKLAASRVGLRLEPVFDDWDVLLGKLKDKKLDMVGSIYRTPQRESFVEFTEPYLELYDAIFTTDTTTDIFSASDLIGRTVAVEKGFYTIDLLKKDFPGIKLLIVDNTLDALKAVSSGKADAYIGTQYVGSYLIKKFIISNLKTVGFLGDDPNKIYMGIRKDWPVLRDILNKGLASISDEEKQQILRKFIILDSGGAKKTNLIKLTDDEKAWLADHKHMRFGVDPGYPPFEFIDDDGVFSGMSSDYVRLVSERLGITMELVPGLSWVEVLDGVKNHTLDFTPALSPTVERNEHMNFTPPHMAFPAVIVTRDNHALVNGLEDLSGTTAALVKAVAVTDIVTAWHPGIITEMFDTPLQALQSVALGKTDATVMNLAVVTYLIKKHGLANLKIAAPAEVDIQGLSFGVRKDWPEFISIINKALASITPEEESAIRSRWAQVSYNTGIDIKQVIQAGGVVIVILIVIVVWNRRLQIEVNQRKVAEGQMKAAKNEAERLTIAKSDFIAVISHEIRTPMNGVLGMARLLTETKLDNEQEECVDTIVESGEALLTIIDDLLDISKFDAGKLDIESIPFIVDVVIEQSMSLMKSRAEEKGLKLDSDIDADIPGVIIGDPHRLRQIILNLISNAIKFTDKGTIDVETRMASRTENEATLSFVVTDTGKGIPPDGLAKIFSAYGQGSSEVARKYGGTGLGLAICRRLASRMNGEISVESEVGKGSAFKFEATFEIDNTSDANAIRMLHTTDKEPPSNEQTAHPMKVLQVEDNETNRTVVERVLSRVGHTVISVENGEVALQAIQAGDFDVILMDRHMPVMDGLEATRRIREMDGPVASIPIIGITASASQDEIQACIDAGMDDCLTKPVVAAKLRARLDTLHDGNHAPSSLPSPTGVDEPDTSSQQHPVDLHRLAEILGEDDDDELFSMLEIFNNEFPKLLDKLETAIRDGDVRDVHDCAHTAKGAAANAAAHTLSAILKEIEVDAHLENRALTDQRMQAVAVEYERVIHFCRNKGQQV